MKRNISINILKCIAAILITNSHMDLLYGKYSTFATGGAIGDALFFFCSGFTLFLGRTGRFDNWYKRRINRIYPTVFAWAILGAFLFGYNFNMRHTILFGGGWFVACIMMYYVFLYFIQHFMFDKLRWGFAAVMLICVVWYILLDKPAHYNMYGNVYYLKWGFYFLFMLLGSMLGISKWNFDYCFKWDMLKLLVSVFVFYGIQIIGLKISVVHSIQLITLIPLLFVVFYFYKICNSKLLKRCYDHRIGGWLIKFIGGLCLEIYLVQDSLFTDKMNNIFPLNIPIIFSIIVFAAYILRCASRIFSQTFKEQEFDWKSVIKAV